MQEREEGSVEVSGSGRRRLMTAASKLFAKVGISEVTVAQILESSGVKAPTLYHHFGGKEGLYVCWVGNTLDVLESEFRSLSGTSTDLRDFLVSASKLLLSQRSMDVLQVMRDRKWLADPDSVEHINDALRNAVFSPVSRAIERECGIRDASDYSQIFVHMVSVRRPCYLRAGSTDPAQHVVIVDLFLKGIVPVKPSPDGMVRERASLPEDAAGLK